ncbi:putative pyrroline-5-carboxylate reductase [Necator americanus]|uniref:pyrroline-5-carboxylate reductase n=1 Tax=Necator americanus TaxID=51031 RepID=W2TYP8_NECAM|nr:putative pyrroline-5-carboxylate reductase [Necator americanus]ETN86764.1 putative pyrroline-5-carboxylate reductase [Necator americanus]
MSELSRYCLAAGITKPKLLFVGGGNMASALANGCVSSGIIVLAVKPQARHDVIDSMLSDNTNLANCPLIISILAGIDEKILEKELKSVGYLGPIVRLFPNTAVAIGSGASILCAEPNVYMFIESLADGGVFVGCSRESALKLAAQTVMGAAEMVLESSEHPAVLKDKVCSPGGTTIAGLRELERSGFRSAVIEAVKAATDRANSMS